MLTCQECKEQLYPDDPTFPVGKYHQSSCDYYCDKPTYYREIEKASTLVAIEKHPVVNVTYQVPNMDSTPYFKAIREEITLIHGRLTKYFEGKQKKLQREKDYEPF